MGAEMHPVLRAVMVVVGLGGIVAGHVIIFRCLWDLNKLVWSNEWREDSE